MANCSSDASFMNDDFSELLWDNGPVVLQAPWKSSLQTTYTHVSRVEERDSKDCTYPHIGHFRPIEPKVNFHPIYGFSEGFGVHAEEENVDPWNYTVEESLSNVYCLENLTDFSGNGSDPSRVIPSQLFQLPHQFTKSRTIDSGFGGTDNADEDQDQDGEGLKSPSTHFVAPLDIGNKKATAAVPRNPVESILIESRGCLKSSLENQDRPVLKPISELKLGSSPKSPQEVIIIDIPEDVREEDTYRKNNHKTTGNFAMSPDQIQSSSFAWSAVLERHETGRDEEAALASSGSNIKTASSNDHNHREKRMRHKGEEFGYQSEDVEGESLGLKKPCMSRGKNTKRNRAAEVHNLSERRRRDRINEKMRALQELIPNCNKTDKASMLDDAIEYLKTLQMQLQIMSTGGGFCVHPMMMMMMQQHIRAATMPHFSPMSAGMGMGMDYGNGMYKVNGSPPCHFVPVAPFHGTQFPRPFHHLPGSSILPILEKPGQRFPMSMAYQGPATSAPCPTTSSQRNTSSEKMQKSSTGDSQNSENFSGTKECFEDRTSK